MKHSPIFIRIDTEYMLPSLRINVTDGTRHEVILVPSGPGPLASMHLSVLVARSFGIQHFRLSLATPLATLTAGSLGAAEVVSTSQDAPAAMVDPFWACEGTQLPQTRGIAARWYWPKARAGNTHPGASLPHGMVSVVPYSGGYPTGYGTNGVSLRGMPASAASTSSESSLASWPYQYHASGFTHFQQSGTGSIGNYYNFVKVMPVRATAVAFITAGAPWLDRPSHWATLVGERAVPGSYSALLAEANTFAEVASAPAVALHRYTFRDVPAAASSRGAVHGTHAAASVAIDLTAAGLRVPGCTQAIRGLTATVGPGWIDGELHTPPPTRRSSPAATGVVMYFYLAVEVGGSGSASAGARFQLWPDALRNLTSISLNASDLRSLGSVGAIVMVAPPATGATASATGTSSSTSAPRRAPGVAVELRIGFSLRSRDDARAAVAAVSDFSFDEVAGAAWRAWNDELSVLDVQVCHLPRLSLALPLHLALPFLRIAHARGFAHVQDAVETPGDERERSLFYSTLFHALRKPASLDSLVAAHASTSASDHTADGLSDGVFDLATVWDTYKTSFPLLLTFYPRFGSRLLDTMLSLGRAMGRYLPEEL